MFLNTLDKKPLLKKDDGFVIRDLTVSIFDFNSNNYINYQAYRVPMEYQMRCDLIAQSVYNNTLYAEVILKFNGISNPFTISNGDVILIPDLNSAKQNIKNEGEQTDNSAENKIRQSYKYIDPTKAPTQDPISKDFDSRTLQDPIPPNIAPEGQKQITYRNGRVYFGEGIAESACLKSGMSSGEYLTTIIRSRNV